MQIELYLLYTFGRFTLLAAPAARLVDETYILAIMLKHLSRVGRVSRLCVIWSDTSKCVGEQDTSLHNVGVTGGQKARLLLPE